MRQALEICPLCGQETAQLYTCRGCEDSWQDESLAATYGPEAKEKLRAAYREALTGQGAADALDELGKTQIPLELVQRSEDKAWESKGCRICRVCRRQTIPVRMYEICPLYLLGRTSLEGHLVGETLAALLKDKDEAAQNQIMQDYLNFTFKRWCETLNEGQTEDQLNQIAAWRHLLLRKAWKL